MAQRRKKRKGKTSITLICILLLCMTVGVGLLAAWSTKLDFSVIKWLGSDAENATSRPSSGSETDPFGETSGGDAPVSNAGTNSTPDVPSGVPEGPIEAHVPDEMRAVMLTPNQDYPVTGDTAAIKAGIDDALEKAVRLTMNTVVLDTKLPDGLLYASPRLPSPSFEEGFHPLTYATAQARAAGLYVYAIFYVADNGTGPLGCMNSTALDVVSGDAASFSAVCQPDGVLLDGYYNVADDLSYQTYLQEGGGIGYDAYMQALPQELVKLSRKVIQKGASAIQVGLLSEAVWANASDNERGSKTVAPFATLTDGNADTLDMLDKGLADFIAVKAYGSTNDPAVPFGTLATWWAERAADVHKPLYMVHAADKAVTDAVGWGEYDQLSRQVIEVRDKPGYGGSIFNSLSRMLEDPKEFATKLIGYYAGTVKKQHILTNLEVTQPAQLTYTSFDQTVVFAGNTDPNTDASINGVKITTDENGYFRLEMDLNEGLNAFQIVHKGKTVTYNITRVIEVVKEVTPTGKLTADGGTKLTISAIAYKQAKIYAVINGQTVSLSAVEDQGDDEYKGTPYGRFSGSYTVPDATTTVQNLGAIVVYGEWGGYQKNKTGAALTVNARALPSDGKPVMVTSEWAETFPSDTLSHYSDPSYFPLPQGALDYAIGAEIKYTVTERGKTTNYSFYRLQSGLRVLTDDITVVSTDKAPVGNSMGGCTVSSDARHTTITLATRQKVAFTARYSPDAITLQFHYTNSMPDSMTLTKNPLFTAASFKGDTLTLPLRERGVFLGYDSYFDDAGNLVFRFNNPPRVSGNNLSGVKIVIDPGHGGNDPGALGYLAAYPEKVINLAIAKKLASTLNGRGADARLIENSGNPTLEQRVLTAVRADPNLMISIHSNSSTSSAGTGSEAYYFTPFSYNLAANAAAKVASALGTTNRGGKPGYYYVTRNTQFPSMLVETGFVSNRDEYSKLVDDDYQSGIATAIADAVCTYFERMGNNAGLTGTQSSGSSVAAGKPPTTSQGGGVSASTGTESRLSITLSDTSLKLAMDDEETLLASIDGLDEKLTYSWNAEGSKEVVKLHYDADSSDVLSILALNPGRVTIRVSTKEHPELSASCTITVEE